MGVTAEELDDIAGGYLDDRAGACQLPRTLFLIGGLSDEQGKCFDALSIAGRQMFTNWDSYATRISFPWSATAGNLFPADSKRAGQQMNTFLDFGEFLREVIGQRYPDRGVDVGEYDIVAHSMGGLDTFAALVPLPPTATDTAPSPGLPTLAKAFNVIACDSPFRGIPSADIRSAQPDMRLPTRHAQCIAIDTASNEIKLLTSAIPQFCKRVERLRCLAAETAVYIEVPTTSSNILGDPGPFASRDEWQRTRQTLNYRSAIIPGAVHSADNGLTSTPTGIAEIFSTILNETW